MKTKLIFFVNDYTDFISITPIDPVIACGDTGNGVNQVQAEKICKCGVTSVFTGDIVC